MNVTPKSDARLRALMQAADVKTGARHLSFSAAVQDLCDGYPGAMTASVAEAAGNSEEEATADTGAVALECGGRLRAILEAVNAHTGASDPTLTEAVQRLCDGYEGEVPLYSFAALSDLHMQYETGRADLERALTYLRDRVAFTCVCGDLVAWAGEGTVSAYGTKDYMEQYRLCVEQFAGDMPVYECAGNHESYPAYQQSGSVDADVWTATTGKPLYYAITQGEDVFLFVSLRSDRQSDPFPEGALEWLEEELEAHREQRCFVFQHCPEQADKAADPLGVYATILNGAPGQAFVALMKRYPRVVWFHGHTHLTLEEASDPVSDRDVLGYRSVHIPSLASVRFYDPSDPTQLPDYDYDGSNKIWGSQYAEGYIVDVYPRKIVLRGINFAAGDDRTQVEAMAGEVYALTTGA